MGGFIGALSGGPAANIIGRKWSIILTNIFTLLGSFLQAYPMGAFVFDGESYTYPSNTQVILGL